MINMQEFHRNSLILLISLSGNKISPALKIGSPRRDESYGYVRLGSTDMNTYLHIHLNGMDGTEVKPLGK